MNKRTIVTICGSMQFENEMRTVAAILTERGYIVLMPHVNGKNVELTEHEKAQLDALHKDKISMSDLLVVVSRHGYVGDSTASEIGFARSAGLEIEHYDVGYERLY